VSTEEWKLKQKEHEQNFINEQKFREDKYKSDLKKKLKDQQMEYDTTKFKSIYYD
jgi:hypothetical protein